MSNEPDINFIKQHEANIEAAYAAIEDHVLRVIPIVNHNGTQFYALLEYSRIGNKMYTYFLAPNFNKINHGGSKYEFWYKEFKEIESRINKWKRQRMSDKPNPFPFPFDAEAKAQYIASKTHKKSYTSYKD